MGKFLNYTQFKDKATFPNKATFLMSYTATKPLSMWNHRNCLKKAKKTRKK